MSTLLLKFDPQATRTIIELSNHWAGYNENDYPEEMSNAISTLYEKIACPCKDDCECKKYKCNMHFIRKKNLDYTKVFEHYLNCYFDKKQHKKLKNNDTETSGRGKNSIKYTKIIKERWNALYCKPYNLSLLCTSCLDDASLKECFDINLLGEKPSQDNIYMSKWLSMLSLDVFVAYDTESIKKLQREYKSDTYLGLMRNIRAHLIGHLNKHEIDINHFRGYENSNSPLPIGYLIDKLYLSL